MGHTLCKNIEDYTEAQITFLALVNAPQEDPRTIKDGDSKEEIMNKLMLWGIKK